MLNYKRRPNTHMYIYISVEAVVSDVQLVNQELHAACRFTGGHKHEVTGEVN